MDGSSAAFILSDFEFRLKGNKHMTLNSPSNIKRASIVNIKWCFQKNNDNGQVISYVIDHKNKTYCAIEDSKKIYSREIKHNIPSNKPIAIFIEVKNNKKKTCFIDDVHIKTILQEAAQSIYHITKKEDISKFTAHSIRVGAYVLLHAQNISSEDIKFRLRWRSDSFRMYLRNINQLAERHKDAIANAE